MARLKTMYQQEVAPALMKKFGYKSVMQIPRLDKIVINVGCGDAKDNTKAIEAIVKISQLSQVRRLLLQRQENPLLTLSSVRAWLLALRLLFARIRCGSSSTDSST